MTDNEVLTAIRQECHNLDKRLAVVETRQEMQDHRIESIETTAHEILVMLRTHELMVNLMTQAEYARHRGVSPPAVHAAIKRGRITLVDGKIDSAQADIEWDKNTDHGRRENAFGNANRQRAEYVKSPGDANEALDLCVYNLAAAHFLGLHKRRPSEWKRIRDRLEPATGDLFAGAAPSSPASPSIPSPPIPPIRFPPPAARIPVPTAGPRRVAVTRRV